MLKKKNTPDAKEKFRIAKIAEYMDAGMDHTCAVLKYVSTYMLVDMIETPDRYKLIAEDELYNQVRAAVDLGTNIQKHTVTQLKSRDFRLLANRLKKSPQYRNISKKTVKTIIDEMFTRRTRFVRKSALHKYNVSDKWLTDTVQYACTNVGLLWQGYIDEAELKKRCYSLIFRLHKAAPTAVKYDDDIVTIPKFDGVNGLDVPVKDLTTRKKLRNIRLHPDGNEGITICVHHKDHHEREHKERQLKIARKTGLLPEEVVDKLEDEMQVKTDLTDLFK